MIGAGWYGMLANLPSLADYDGAELVAICDTDPLRAKEAAERFGVPRRFTDVGALVDAGIADGVVVSVPHTAHHPVCSAALDAGLHVLVDKPMAVCAADAWDMVRRAGKRGLHLVAGQTFQFTTVAARVRAELPRIGELVQIVGEFASSTERLFRGEPASPDGRGASYGDSALSGGGQGHTQLSHLLGLVCWTTGLRGQEVFAYFENRGLRVDLVNALAVRFSGGVLGSFAGTGTTPRHGPVHERVTYHGTRGALMQDLAAAEADLLVDGGPPERFRLRSGESAYPLAAPARAFADLIAGRIAETPAPADVAAWSVELLDAAYRSAEQGMPVRIEKL